MSSAAEVQSVANGDPVEPLKITGATPFVAVDGISELHGITLHVNRAPTEVELRMYAELPATPTMFRDAQSYAERMVLAELVVRLFRFYILGGIVLPDSPAAMDWLKTFIDGNGHGPLGYGPLRWPSMVPSAQTALDRWGFVNAGGFVAKRPGD